MMLKVKPLIAIAAALSLGGCFALSTSINPPSNKPVKPYLPSYSRLDDGGMQLDKADTERLFKYILDLEHGYER